jgi:hypothetical protein
MRKTLLTLSFFLVVCSMQAQSNLSFETWTTDDPDGWTTSNQISAIGGPITVVQETALPGTGAISAHLSVETCAICGFFSLPDPFPGLMIQQTATTVRPANLSFKWRGNVATGDTSLIGGAVTLAGSQVGDAYFTILPGTNQATWVVQSIPFNYFNSNIPDTLTLGALCDQYLLFGGTGTTSTSTEIYVDDFILTGTVGVELLETNNSLIFAFPNPASTQVNFNLLGTDASMLEVFDNSGKLVYAENNIQMKQKLDVQEYENGSYVVRFLNDKKEYIGTARFCVVR